MRRRAPLDFFVPTDGKPQQSQGGARPSVEAKAQQATSTIGRVYNAPSVRNYDTSDPRYEGKSDQVENIYLPAAEVANKPRSGVAQIFNWLVNGRLA